MEQDPNALMERIQQQVHAQISEGFREHVGAYVICHVCFRTVFILFVLSYVELTHFNCRVSALPALSPVRFPSFPQVTDKCFKTCVTSPSTSLSSRENSCMERCMDRFVDAMNVVTEALSDRSQRSN